MVLTLPAKGISYDSLLLDHANQVLSYLQRLVGDISVAHRLTEETFAEMARYYRKRRLPNQPRALVYLIATARAREYLRKGDKRNLWQRLFQRDPAPALEFGEEHVRALANDTGQRALSTLNLSDRIVLLLHDYCGLTYEEVARAAGVGRSAVPRDLDRARHEFKQAFDYIRF
jgi:RNA polymerase sigma factor (sigma-70 family)